MKEMDFFPLLVYETLTNNENKHYETLRYLEIICLTCLPNSAYLVHWLQRSCEEVGSVIRLLKPEVLPS